MAGKGWHDLSRVLQGVAIILADGAGIQAKEAAMKALMIRQGIPKPNLSLLCNQLQFNKEHKVKDSNGEESKTEKVDNSDQETKDDIFVDMAPPVLKQVEINNLKSIDDIVSNNVESKFSNFVEQSIPSNSIHRASIFGLLGVRLAFSTKYNKFKEYFRSKFNRYFSNDRKVVEQPAQADITADNAKLKVIKPISSQPKREILSNANADILVAALCRLRGAALKLGQMLSIQDSNVIPAAFTEILSRVRDSANIMPRKQLDSMLVNEFGDWRTIFKWFHTTPLAAASIGQVHEAMLKDGQHVAVKIQYPGVSESITSDLANLKRLVTTLDVLPKGMYIDKILAFARTELLSEVDYNNEAGFQKRYRDLIIQDKVPFVYVPKVFQVSKRILIQEFVRGVPISQLPVLNPTVIQSIAKRYMYLTLKEIFGWRFVQTDPNWSNYLYDEKLDVLNMVDFGACREYSEEFVNEYTRLVEACANRNREVILDSSLKLGFLTGRESKTMINAHVSAAFAVGEPFQVDEYDFANTDISGRVVEFGNVMLKERLTAPPMEAYTIHRKLAGAFSTCVKLSAKLPARKYFYSIIKKKQPPLPLL